MKCSKCGREVQEGWKFCNFCGNVLNNSSDTENENVIVRMKKGNTEGKNKEKKIKFSVSDVVNYDGIINSTNKVAYGANCWAVQVKRTGDKLVIIVVIIYFIMACVNSSNVYDDEFIVFISTFITGIIYAFIIQMTFNTISFLIKMGAEVIQLLEDIKNK